MKIQKRLASAVLMLVPGIACASLNLNIDQPIWSFASYDLAGNPIPTEISYSYPFGTPTADNGSVPYWTATTTFSEPQAGESLVLFQLRPDDRAIVLLNGVQIGAYGRPGPGLGSFVFTPGGPELPQFFQYSCCEDNGEALDAVVDGPFAPGLNTLEFIVNNTNQGIFGPLTDLGPSRLSFEGDIGVAPPPPPPPPPGVPEPGTWALSILGFFGLGAGLRSSRRARLRASVP